jgi:phage gpG-like protein
MSNFINADVDIGKFNTIIAIMRRCSVETRPVMAAVGNLVVKSVRRNFREGGRPNKWPESKKPKGKTLIGTGALMKSIHYELDSDGTAVTVMTGPMNYARTMQNGGSTAAHEIWYKNRQALRFFRNGTPVFYGKVNHPGSHIPARPYMMLQDEDEKKIKDMLVDHFVSEMKKRGGLK